METEDEEEAFPWPLTGEEEAQIARKADAISPPPVTPKKPLRTTDAYATPSTSKRKLSEVDDVGYPALPTPGTTGRSDKRFANPLADMLSGGGTAGLRTPQTTPTPSRFKDALSGEAAALDLSTDVVNVLQQHNVRLGDEARAPLLDLLHKNSLRVQGIIKGRDVSRLQIKAKDAKIAEQQLRITTLEAELEAERALVQHLKWEKQNATHPD